ncbi:MAG: hypothetical protein JXQ73_22465 [Phycisphaerae bacterium]|nr:hypothetical protein [Phycisphaerae bacterium]
MNGALIRLIGGLTKGTLAVLLSLFGFLALAFAACLIFLAVLVPSGPPSDVEIARLKAQGLPIVEQIERYKKQQGAYPSELKTTGIVLPAADFGGWRYSTYADGKHFALSLGRYERDGFTLSWFSGNHEWCLDT